MGSLSATREWVQGLATGGITSSTLAANIKLLPLLKTLTNYLLTSKRAEFCIRGCPARRAPVRNSHGFPTLVKIQHLIICVYLSIITGTYLQRGPDLFVRRAKYLFWY
jgi:hypothetical protein